MRFPCWKCLILARKKARTRGRAGDGTVFERPDGKWIARISLGGRAHRKFKSRVRSSEAAANEALRELRAEFSYATSTSEIPLTLKDHMKRWLAAQKPRVRAQTYAQYESTIRLHIVPTLGAYRVDRIKPGHVADLMEKLTADGDSARMRELVYLRLRAGLASIGTVNPVRPEHRPRVPKKAMKIWTQDEARTFLEAAAGNWWEHLYRLALSTGMRKGEILGLRWVDVDVKARRISIQHTLPPGHVTENDLEDVKTRASRRAIELPSNVVKALVAQKERLLAAGLRRCCWVFPTALGVPVQPKTLDREFGYLMHRAKVPRIRFHDLRHTCATLRLASGEPVKVVSEMLGHSSVVTTMETYQHVTATLQRESADRFDAIL